MLWVLGFVLEQLARRNGARTLPVDASITRRAKVEAMAHSSACRLLLCYLEREAACLTRWQAYLQPGTRQR